MAHFAKIGLNNKVIQTIVVNDKDCQDANGNEVEEIGRQFCENLTGYPHWVQTSYNNNIRKNFAGVGHIWDEDRNAFIAKKPYPSWVLNEDTCQWEAPVARDDDTKNWNEETQSWE
tara:strand:- start:884 stop:1231 length:348 start_codon:yes stop_codon:yes gene_type:complete